MDAVDAQAVAGRRAAPQDAVVGARAPTVEVISGVPSGAGVVQRNRDPVRRTPRSRRSLVMTGGCRDGRSSTSLCGFRTALIGASIRTSHA
ncbi:hypothetical protein [Streptomyces sp. NPDC058735]|uniref:hypothetical protein n=1 Tax=unclassified Streptomyces TaxID=2593676 RepID=UPI0036CEA748